MTHENVPPSPAGRQLRRLRAELRKAREEARSVAAGLSRRQTWWRPEPGSWSVGECLDHLVRTGEAYLPDIDRALAEARDGGLEAEGPFSRGFLGRWLVRGMEPPPGFGIPAPQAFLPRRVRSGRPGAGRSPGAGSAADAPDGDPPLPRFVSLQGRLERRLEEAEGLDLETVHVPFPVAPLLRINLFAGFAYLAAHQRRHLWQARQVKEEEGWPGAG